VLHLLSKNASNLKSATQTFGFFAATLIELLEKYNIQDQHLRVMLPYLLDGMKSSSSANDGYEHPRNEYRRCCCMIFVQLARKLPTMANPLQESILRSFIDAYYITSADDSSLDPIHRRLSSEILTSLVVISQYQKFSPRRDTVEKLVGLSSDDEETSLLETVFELKKDYDILPLVVQSIKAIVSVLVDDAADDSNNEAFAKAGAKILETSINRAVLDSAVAEIVEFSLTSLMETKTASTSASHESLLTMLQMMFQRYGRQFEECVLKLRNLNDGDSNPNRLQELIVGIFSASKHHIPEDRELSLYMLLMHPSPSLRIEGLQLFVQRQTSDEEDLSDLVAAVMSCLEDKNISVAAAAWTEDIVQRLLSIKMKEEITAKIFAVFCAALDYWWQEPFNRTECSSIVGKIFKTLAGDEFFQLLSSFSAGSMSGLVKSILVILFSSDARYSDLRRSCYDVMHRIQQQVCIFKGLKKLKKNDTAQENLVSTVSTNLMDQPQPCIEILRELGIFLDASLSTQVDHNPLWTFFSSLQRKLVSARSDSEKWNYANASLLTILIPNAIKWLFLDNEVDEVIVDILSGLGVLPDKAYSQLKSTDKVLDVVKTADFRISDMKIRVLLALMHSTKGLPYIGNMIESCFRKTFVPLLTSILLGNTTSDSEFMSKLQSSNDFPNELAFHVSESSKAVAFHILATYVNTWTTNPLDLNLQMQTLEAILPPVLANCFHTERKVRSAALSLLESMSRLSSDDNHKKGSNTDATKSVSRSDIIFVAKYFIRKSELIASNSFALDILSSSLLSEPTATRLVNTLLWSSTLYGFSAPDVTSTLFSLCRTVSVEVSWPHIEQYFQDCQLPGNEIDTKLSNASLDLISNTKDASAALVSKIVKKIFSEEILAGATPWTEELRRLILQTVCQHRFQFLEHGTEHVATVYHILVMELLHRAGSDPLLLDAIKSLDIPLEVIYKSLLPYISEFNNTIDEQSSSTAAAMMVDDDDNYDGAISNLSVPLEKFVALIQLHSPIIGTKLQQDNSRPNLEDMSALAVILFATFRKLNRNDEKFRLIYGLEYSLAAILELIAICMPLILPAILTNITSVSTSRKQKSASSTTKAYSLERVEEDVEQLLACLSTSRTVSLQSTVLKVVRLYIEANLHADVLRRCIARFGELLSTSSVATNLYASREEMIRSLLVAFAGSHAAGRIQDVLQSLCLHFHRLSSSRREDLLRLALNSHGPIVMPILTNLLLIHSLAANSHPVLETAAMITGQDEKADIQFIVLSRAAQRKAHREQISSISEELYRQGVDLSSAANDFSSYNVISADVMISNLVVQMKLASYVFDTELRKQLSVDAMAEAETNAASDPLLSANIKDGVAMSLDAKKSLDYLAGLSGIDEKEVAKLAYQRIGLGILSLEFVLEILRNKSFHRSLLELVDAQKSITHEYLVAFCEQLLEVVNLASKLQYIGTSSIRVEIDGVEQTMSCNLLGKQLEVHAMEILSSTTRLVDLPTFVQLMEELMLHPHQSIRQRTLQVLSLRLESMNEEKSLPYESSLFLDLVMKLRQAVSESKDEIVQLLNDETSNEIPQFGLCQSALLCLDVVTRRLTSPKSSSSWLDEIALALEVTTALGSLIHESIPKIQINASTCTAPAKKIKSNKADKSATSQDRSSSAVLFAGLAKLQGSLILACGSLAAALGPRSLSRLQDIMNITLSTISNNHKQIEADHVDIDRRLSTSTAFHRVQVLLLRSALSALVTLIQSNSHFIHPYVDKILTTALPLHDARRLTPTIQASEAEALSKDVDLCLHAIILQVPTRLLMPSIMKASSKVFGSNHACSKRFIVFLDSLWTSLDRPAIAQYSSNLCSLATLMLDYRRVYGDQSEEAASVDEIAINAVVSLSLKFTEAELKSFLTRLHDWKDVQLYANDSARAAAEEAIDPNEKFKLPTNYRALSRDVQYYHLVAGLAEKLRVLFLPTLAAIWPQMVKAVDQMKYLVSDAVQLASAGKKSKRARDGAQAANQDRAVITEMLARCQHIFEAVTTCANGDNSQQLIDENRFSSLMPVTISLLEMTTIYEDVASYTRYSEESVIPCLSAIAIAISNDLQWKPLNHKVLMLMRDERKEVRMIGLKSLKRLFEEVSYLPSYCNAADVLMMMLSIGGRRVFDIATRMLTIFV
jgi:hypothetical protein